MKKYIKDDIIKYANEIVICNEQFQIINPTEEMLINDGWVEYVPEVIEITDEERLEIARESLYEKINSYDQSNAVNAFYMTGVEMWFDKATRVGLMLRFLSENAMGINTTSLWYGNISYELSVENAIQMLYSLEIYASNCYDNTQRHIANVANLENIEDIENYNYFEGYPDKLQF
jgi:hypothetical protein